MARDRPGRTGTHARWMPVAVVVTTAVLAVVTAVAVGPPVGVLEDEDRDSRGDGVGLAGQSPEPSADPLEEPVVRLPEPAGGRRAIELLGDELPAAARLNDMAAQRLRELLREDPTVWLDRTGRVFFIDDAASETASPP